MKKTITTLVALAIACTSAITASAEKNNKDYNRFAGSLEVVNYSSGWNELFSGGEIDTFTGVGVGVSYIHGFGLPVKLPFYIETGLKLGTAFHSEDDATFSNINLQTPVNLTYSFKLAKGKIRLAPYLGLNFKFNCLANIHAGGKDFNCFDDPFDFRVFQLGWHVGANFTYNKLYAGMSFGTDFINATPKTSTVTFNVSIGVQF